MQNRREIWEENLGKIWFIKTRQVLNPVWCRANNLGLTLVDFPQFKTTDITTIGKQPKRTAIALKATIGNKLFRPITIR